MRKGTMISIFQLKVGRIDFYGPNEILGWDMESSNFK